MNRRTAARAALFVVAALFALAVTVPATAPTVAGILAAGLLALPFVAIAATVVRVRRSRAVAGVVRIGRHDLPSTPARERRARLAHRTIIDPAADVVFVEGARL